MVIILMINQSYYNFWYKKIQLITGCVKIITSFTLMNTLYSKIRTNSTKLRFRNRRR